MALTSGSRIGHYEVGAPLGAGGMGQVYRARDTQLGRDVAIKALPDSMAADPERVARFQREAQVLAALSHPNIGAIYGLETDGKSKYLILEFVEGVTLADHIQKSARPGHGLPLNESIAIARQIIDALEAAHDKAIVHRDLKPANIMVALDGQVKVLDFGLARAESTEGSGAHGGADSPTLTAMGTQAGVILGTAAYMSPEQAKGRIADKRSDVWAFGCVFYEMLTGKRLFEGEDVTETLAAVLRAEPEWAALPKDVPADIRALLQRCLERDRKRRIPDMAVVRFLLDDRSAGASAGGPSATGTPGLTAGPARTAWRVAAIALGIAVTAIVLLITDIFAPRPEPALLSRFSITPPEAQRLAPTGADRQLTMSADGRFMVYVSGFSSAGGQLVMRAFDQLDAQPITGAVGARHPFLSPDGKWVGYFSGSELRKIPVAGGASSLLCPVDGAPRGAAWLEGDVIVFASSAPTTGLQSVPAAGGSSKNLTTPAPADNEGDHYYPTALPGGRAVLFTVIPANLQVSGMRVDAFTLDTGARKQILKTSSGAEYAAGSLLYAAGGSTINAIRFDPSRLEVQGEPSVVLSDAAVILSGVPQVAASRSGMLVYVPDKYIIATTGGGSDRTVVWVTRQGKETPIKGLPLRSYFALRLSPDETKIAVDIRDQENDIWVWDVARANLQRLTFFNGADTFPIWTHDSRRVVFASTRDGAFNLYLQNADGSGTTDRLTTFPYGQYPASALPDGSGIIAYELKAAQNPDVGLLKFGGKGEVTPVLSSPAVERIPEISPDGKFILYESNESSNFEVYVRPFPDTNGGKWQISTAGGTKASWSRTGNEIFYLSPDNKLMAVPVKTSPVFAPGNPSPLFPAENISTLASGRFYDVARDGRFVMIKELPPKPGATPVPAGPTFVVVMNWAEGVRGK